MKIVVEKSVFQDLRRLGVVRIQRLYDVILRTGLSGSEESEGDRCACSFKDGEITLIGTYRKSTDTLVLDRIAFDYVTDSDDDLLTLREIEDYVSGKHPVAIWREHRGMSLAELARQINRSQGYLSDIEKRKKPGSLEIMREIADALKVDVRDILD